MSRILTYLAAPFLALALTVPQARADETRALYEAMGLPQILEIMRDEGLAYGSDLHDEMFAGQGIAGWDRRMSGIYSVERMERTFLAPFETALEGADLEPLLGFFNSATGREIVSLEVSARRALLDEAVEESAQEIWQDLRSNQDPKLDLIERFVVANDLIEANVAGAMNSSLAFYEGLASNDAFDGAWTADRILATVWEQEAEIREETRMWIYPYLTLAFEPLEAEDIEAYISLSESEEGRGLNSALFAAFDVLFVEVSRDVGTAAAEFMQGEDI